VTKKEKELLERIEKRFARHKGDKIMAALKEISTRYLTRQLQSRK